MYIIKYFFFLNLIVVWFLMEKHLGSDGGNNDWGGLGGGDDYDNGYKGADDDYSGDICGGYSSFCILFYLKIYVYFCFLFFTYRW